MKHNTHTPTPSQKPHTHTPTPSQKPHTHTPTPSQKPHTHTHTPSQKPHTHTQNVLCWWWWIYFADAYDEVKLCTGRCHMLMSWMNTTGTKTSLGLRLTNIHFFGGGLQKDRRPNHDGGGEVDNDDDDSSQMKNVHFLGGGLQRDRRPDHNRGGGEDDDNDDGSSHLTNVHFFGGEQQRQRTWPWQRWWFLPPLYPTEGVCYNGDQDKILGGKQCVCVCGGGGGVLPSGIATIIILSILLLLGVICFHITGRLAISHQIMDLGSLTRATILVPQS